MHGDYYIVVSKDEMSVECLEEEFEIFNPILKLPANEFLKNKQKKYTIERT